MEYKLWLDVRSPRPHTVKIPNEGQAEKIIKEHFPTAVINWEQTGEHEGCAVKAVVTVNTNEVAYLIEEAEGES